MFTLLRANDLTRHKAFAGTPFSGDMNSARVLCFVQVQRLCIGNDSVFCICDTYCVNLPIGSMCQTLQPCAKFVSSICQSLTRGRRRCYMAPAVRAARLQEV